MKEKFDVEDLLARYRKGICTPAEISNIESWHLDQLKKKKITPDIEEMEAAGTRMWQKINLENATTKLNRRWFYVAACFLLLSGFGLLLWKLENGKSEIKQNYSILKSPIISPGSNNAILTLDNGKQIILDSSSTGFITSQGQAQVSIQKNGLIQYKNESIDLPVQYNTIRIPRAGQYQLRLADGTAVWLNSATTIRYPTSFSGATRQVEVSGEAYFEVARDKNRPFVVVMPNQKIEVLGTHFNVHAYEDEETTETTLLEGKIRISKNTQTAVLMPGQKAINAKGNSLVKVVNVPDPEDAIAWRNGFLNSTHESIYSLMNKISRVYDVEIKYQGNFEGKTFSGTISRFKSINEVLDIIALTESVHFQIEGRRVIVMP